MYNDEQNLYHYTYRKDGSEPESRYEPARSGGSVQEMRPVKKKNRLGWKITALALCCALLGGAAGGGAVWAAARNAAAPADAGSAPVSTEAPQVPDQQESGEDAPSAAQVSAKKDQETLTDAELYAANVDSVVSINVTGTSGINYFGQSVQTASSGSGFVLTQDGYIATNYHVVKDADTVKITMYNGDTYDAKYVGGEEDFDIAVLKVEATGLQSVTLGDSTTLQVGDRVLAIGNPLGELTFSMTGGMVSCVNRTINVDGTPFNMIQTDASINPGNSGGPMFNQAGEVVGIVSAKYTNTSNNTTTEGLGFAIPINDVGAMIKDIMTGGYTANRAYLGATLQTLTKDTAAQYRFNITSGLFVCSTEPGSAADKAGLQLGDVIVKVDGKEIADLDDLTVLKKGYSAGDTSTFVIYRQGKNMEVSVTWGAVPAEQQQTETPDQPDQGGQYGYGSPYDLWDYFFNSRW